MTSEHAKSKTLFKLGECGINTTSNVHTFDSWIMKATHYIHVSL